MEFPGHHLQVRERRKSVKMGMKRFHVCSVNFRHKLAMHATCVRAVAQLPQLNIMTEEPLFTIEQ